VFFFPKTINNLFILLSGGSSSTTNNGNEVMKKDEKGKDKETMESKNTKKTHQKSPDNDNKGTKKTDAGTGDRWIQNVVINN